MAKVPHFVKGEPGFAAKLNELGSALTEALEAIASLTAQVEELKAAKAPAKAAPAKKTATTSK